MFVKETCAKGGACIRETIWYVGAIDVQNMDADTFVFLFKVDLGQLTPISGIGLRTDGDPSYDYIEVMIQYSDTEEGEWKIKRDYRGDIMVCVHNTS